MGAQGKFEVYSTPLGPITADKILKYAMELGGRDCGPTVIPSLRMALRWVALRTNIAMPSIYTALLTALEKEIFTQRGETTQHHSRRRNRFDGSSWQWKDMSPMKITPNQLEF